MNDFSTPTNTGPSRMASQSDAWAIGGKNGYTVDQASNLGKTTGSSFKELSKELSELEKEKQITSFELEQYKKQQHWKTEFDPLQVGSNTRHILRTEAHMEALIKELDTKIGAQKELIKQNHTMMGSATESASKGMAANILAEGQRLTLGGSDNIVANTRQNFGYMSGNNGFSYGK